MPIVYRTAGAWGAGKGSDLTPTEMDGNFHDLAERVRAIPRPRPAMPTAAALSGDVITFTFDDASTIEMDVPYSVFTEKGEWEYSTLYYTNDVVEYEGTKYVVLSDHTSPNPFSLRSTEGLTVLRAIASPAGSIGDGGQYDGAATITPVLGDEFHHFSISVGSGESTFYIPDDATTNFAIGTEFYLYQYWTIPTVVDFPSAVTVNAKTGSDYSTGFVGARVVLKKVAANEWDLLGDQGTA